MTETEVYDKCTELFKLEGQLLKLSEELSELNTEIVRYVNDPVVWTEAPCGNGRTLENVIHEMVDVEIMLNQVKAYLMDNELDVFTKIKALKLKRVETYINERFRTTRTKN